MDFTYLKLAAIFVYINIGLAIRVHYGIHANRVETRYSELGRSGSRHTRIAHQICNSIKNFGPFLKKLCVERTDLYLAVYQGLTHGIKTCQLVFENERWNCTPKGDPIRSGILGFVMARVSKEASFMYAMASAGITHWVTRECYLGKIKNCGCSKNPRKEAIANDFKWHCDVDVGIGMKISRRVMEDGLLKWDAEALMNRHNSDLGRRAVKKHLSFQCKCFGLSGVCTSKTCHRALVPRIETLGLWLKEKYRTAVHVKPSRRSSRSGFPKFLVKRNGKGALPNADSLIYLDLSPNYCEKDPSSGSIGTRGRYCNKTSSAGNSCALLCCGRGYDTHIQTIKQKCNCKFRWCCEVECEECKNTCKVYTCK
ncbi:protein Wnt-7b-like isoform X1 [Rhopilema esculentum]|uniref:protein Wnt-7b-like isoform X1 n=1 Tax=Rhopilema esculentum TaxID=499914 RepID=UPI0031CDB85B